jgi:outer membrane protein assembly factor BamA
MKEFLLFIFILFSTLSLSQKNYTLTFSTDEYKGIKKHVESKFTDSLAAYKYVKDLRNYAIKKGYLLASIDSTRYKKKELNVSFHVGPKFKEAYITCSQENLKKLKKLSSVNEKMIIQTQFSPSEIGRLIKTIQIDFENNGFPFVQVYFQELELKDDVLYAQLNIDEGKLWKWSKIHLKGEELVSERLISSYIQIRVGEIYDHSDVRQISSRLKLIPFVEEIKPAEILFTKEGAELFLYIKSKPVSLANGVIGLQPNPQTGALSLTGDVRLKLVNIVKKAETLDLNWRSIQTQTQSLRTQLNIPNLLSTPFGLDGNFQLYKRDTTFLELKSTAAVQYSMNNGSFLKVFYRNNSSSVLSGGKNNPSFSNLGSVNTNFYGIGINRQTVDYLPNPRKGVLLYSDVAIGSRKSRKTDTSEVITSTTYRGELQIQWFIPLAKRHVLRVMNQTEFYIAPEIFQNETFRFGGQLTQRGFNEEELFATTRSLLSLEYRFLLDRNSFIFLFFDQSMYENASISYFKDSPFGTGAGFSFGTNLGTFSISYALGSQRGNPILFRDGKVHFGYVAFF